MLVIYVTDEQVETASKREATPLCRNFEHCVGMSRVPHLRRGRLYAVRFLLCNGTGSHL